MADRTIAVDGRELRLTSPDKVYFPASDGHEAIAKSEVVDYYLRIAERMVPWVRGRPLVVRRFPDGIAAPGFYQKERPDHFPDWIPSVAVPKSGGTTNHVVVEEAAALVYLANFGCIEFHQWLSTAERPHHPDQLIFDLDPSRDLDDGGLDDVGHAARLLIDLLDRLELSVFLKSSGSRGLHLHVPIDGRDDGQAAMALAVAVAQVWPTVPAIPATWAMVKPAQWSRLHGSAYHPPTLRLGPSAWTARPSGRYALKTSVRSLEC